MLYRLTPPADLTWTNFPVPVGMSLKQLQEHGADLNRLDWEPAEARVFSKDLLRIALRYGAPVDRGIVVDAGDTVELGRADEMRANQLRIDETQAEIRGTHGPLLEQVMPGWEEHGRELDERVRESTEESARESERNLAQILAAPVVTELADHWTELGGELPD